MQNNESTPATSFLSNLHLKKIILPLIIGFGAAFYIIFKSFNPEALSEIKITYFVISMLILALLTNVFRALGYMWRLRILTEKQLTWHQCFQVIMVWEFSSAITPGIVGGAAVTIFLLNKEKINFGRSTGIVLLTGFLDEAVFLVVMPVLFLLFGRELIFSKKACEASSQLPLLNYVDDLSLIVVGVYIIILVITLLIGYGLFIRPRAVKMLFILIGRIKFFKRWKPILIQAGNDIILTSKEFRNKPAVFWIRSIAATALSWTARFALAICIVWGLGLADQNSMLVYARQYAIWLMMLIPTTPGGSGIAEISFMAFMCEFFSPGIISGAVLIWRILSYYIYLIIGAFVLSRWLNRVFRTPPADPIAHD